MKCLSPIRIRNPNWDSSKPYLDEFIHVPCGHCVNCLINKQEEWTGRLICESITSKSSYFITLTYDDSNINGTRTTDKRDVVLFLKRFRKRFDKGQVRYFIVSEYGPTTLRPHYHGILFFKKFVSYAEILEKLEKSWPCYFKVSRFSPQRARYCTKYLFKDFKRVCGCSSELSCENDRASRSDGGGTPILSQSSAGSVKTLRFDRRTGQNYIQETGELVRVGGFSLKSQSIGKYYYEKFKSSFYKFNKPFYGSPIDSEKLYGFAPSFRRKFFNQEQRENFYLQSSQHSHSAVSDKSVCDSLYERHYENHIRRNARL